MKRMNPNWLLMMSSGKDKRSEYGGYDRHERDYDRDHRPRDYDRYDRREDRHPDYDRRRQPDYDEYDGYGKRDYYGEHDMRDRRDYDGRDNQIADYASKFAELAHNALQTAVQAQTLHAVVNPISLLMHLRTSLRTPQSVKKLLQTRTTLNQQTNPMLNKITSVS